MSPITSIPIESRSWAWDRRNRSRAFRTSPTARINTGFRGSKFRCWRMHFELAIQQPGGCILSALPTNQPKDLSPSAIRRAVFGQSLQHPSFVYPAVLGALGGIGAVFVAGSPLVLGAMALAGGAAAAALAV